MIGKIVDAVSMLWQAFTPLERSVVIAWGISMLVARLMSMVMRQRERREQAFADYLLYRMRALQEQPA